MSAVKIFAFLELKQKFAFFKGLFPSKLGKRQGYSGGPVPDFNGVPY